MIDGAECGYEKFESRAVTKEWLEKRDGKPISDEDYRAFVLPYERLEIGGQPPTTT